MTRPRHEANERPFRQVGVQPLESGGFRFTVWAPRVDAIALKLVGPEQREIGMEKLPHGYWQVDVADAQAGWEYVYRLDDDRDRPDPASAFQPHGVHKASAVVDHREFEWGDDEFTGVSLDEMVIYELHVGTFTPEGTFEAAIERLVDLKDMGINTLGIMPVAQFPGERNWGYDGVHPFAVQDSYGGPDGLKRLIDAAHRQDMAVVMDVVYNHLGPEGNYLHEYGHYFTEKYKTPWGWAINFDGPHCDPVRQFFIQNALYWLREYHCDALRLDAVHGIFDTSAKPFLRELAETVAAFSEHSGRVRYLIAESNLNDVEMIRSTDEHGIGMHAQWSDDFHHALHVLVTGEEDGYYADYGDLAHMTKALEEGFVYDWRYSPYRKRRYGTSSKEFAGQQFVISTQTHDQVGNRIYGDRLSALVSFEALKLAAGAMLLAPYVPMLFMGEEYAETAPFLYFVSHGDKDLIEAVRQGRKEEFADFEWAEEPPDPQSEETFKKSKLNWGLAGDGKHKQMRAWYRELIRLRRDLPALRGCHKDRMGIQSSDESDCICIWRKHDDGDVLAVMHFGDKLVGASLNEIRGSWKKLLDSCDETWGGSGTEMPDALRAGDSFKLQGWQVVVYEQENNGE